jgi:hypothetical protein
VRLWASIWPTPLAVSRGAAGRLSQPTPLAVFRDWCRSLRRRASSGRSAGLWRRESACLRAVVLDIVRPVVARIVAQRRYDSRAAQLAAR